MKKHNVLKVKVRRRRPRATERGGMVYERTGKVKAEKGKLGHLLDAKA